MRLLALLVLLCLPLAVWSAQQSPPVPPRDTTVFVRVHVLPMDRERVLRNQTVLVQDGIVVAMAPSLPVPDGARVVDGRGEAWLLPGLADMHNHLDTRQDLAVQLGLGITSTLHMGEARNSFVGRTRAAVAAGEIAGPRVFAALAVDGSPRYGHLVVADAEDARATTRVARANGYDFIKVYNNLSAEAFSALAREARVQDLPLVGHGVTAVGLQAQLEAGQPLVAHAEEFFYTFFPQPPEHDANAAPDAGAIDDAIALLRKHGTAVVADLVTYETIAAQWGRPDVVDGFLRMPESRYLPPAFRASWPMQGYAKKTGSLERRVAFLRRFVKAMDAAGVPLLSGTDAQDIPGLVAGFALHRNLAALVEAGLRPYAALTTATSAPGAFIGRHKPGFPAFGVVREGARADLLLVPTNPLEDMATLQAPLGVMADGRWYPREDLAARMEEVRSAYAAAGDSARAAAQAPTARPSSDSP